MGRVVVINKTGKKFRIKPSGILYHNEICIWNEGYGGDGYYRDIEFRGPDGKLHTGFIEDANGIQRIGDYAWGTEEIDGYTYKILKMRRTERVLTANGNYWGKVAANQYIAISNSSIAGNTTPTILVYYVKSTRGNWVKVSGDGANYGFCNIGLQSGSMLSNASIQCR